MSFSFIMVLIKNLDKFLKISLSTICFCIVLILFANHYFVSNSIIALSTCILHYFFFWTWDPVSLSVSSFSAWFIICFSYSGRADVIKCSAELCHCFCNMFKETTTLLEQDLLYRFVSLRGEMSCLDLAAVENRSQRWCLSDRVALLFTSTYLIWLFLR